MYLNDSSNDHPYMVKLETLTSGGHSLIVQSCYSLDFLLKEMEQLGYFHHMREPKRWKKRDTGTLKILYQCPFLNK